MTQVKQINNIVLPTLSEIVHMKDGKIVLSDLIIPCKKNLFNKENITRNYFYNSNGELTPNSMVYAITDFIKVTPGITYFSSLNAHNCYIFDENKNYISGGWKNFPWTVEEGTGYIRLQLNSSSEVENFMFGIGEKAPGEYYPYTCYTINTELFKDVGGGASQKSPIHGITIDFVGDSITNQETFINYMISNYDIVANKYAQNGITMQNNQIVGENSRLAQADKTADAIVILGGTNDAMYELTKPTECHFGQIGDTTSSTFCGAIDIMCKYLLKNFKGKRILICSPMRRGDTVNGIVMNEQLKKYVEAEKQIVESYGLPFLDLFHSYAHYHFANDGLHPTQESGNLYGRIMAKALENM